MDAQGHEVLVSRIRDWFGARSGHAMSVKVLSGENTEYVAVGPFVRLEEHPTSRGVFRALFDDSLNSGSGPDAEKYVAFGSELQGVVIDGSRLVIDKGDQTIEVVDVGAQTGVPKADEVTWSVPAPPADPEPTAEAAGPPPPPVQATPAPAPAAPAAPAPAPAPATSPGGGQVVEMVVKAPVYDNSMGSGFYGLVTVRIEQGWMTVTGGRSTGGGPMLVGGVLMLVFGAISLVSGLAVAVQATSNSDMGAAFACMGLGLLLLVPGIVLYFVGRARATRGEVATVQFPLAQASGRTVRYDSNLGCLLSLFLSPIVGIIVILAKGKRVVRMTIPAEPGAPARRSQLALKTLSAADGAILERALRG